MSACMALPSRRSAARLLKNCSSAVAQIRFGFRDRAVDGGPAVDGDRRDACRRSVPIRRGRTPAAAARLRTSDSCRGATETTMREADSPNSVASTASASGAADGRGDRTSTVHPIPPVSKQHSASVTASPPSEQSCAERSESGGRERLRRAVCSARSASRSSAGDVAAHQAVDDLQVLAAAELASILAEEDRRRRPSPLNVRVSTCARVLDQPDDADDRRRDRSRCRRSRCRG